jgi:HlyD family secretion protein
MSTRLWLIAAALLVGVVLLALLSGGCSPAVTVETAPATVGPIREFIDEQAKTRLPTTHLITMPAAGRIEAIALTEGATVRRGDVVAQLVPRDVELAVNQARAAVDRLAASIRENDDVNVERTGYRQAEQFVTSMARTVEAAFERVKAGLARLDYTESNLARIATLAAGGAQSQDDLERARLQRLESGFDLQQDRLVHAAMTAMQAATDMMPTMIQQYIDRKRITGEALREQKAEADARLEQALQDQQRAQMRSPVDGVVLQRHVSNERFLPAGERLLEIGSLDEMEIEAEVLTLDVVAAKVGDRVEIYGAAIGPTPAHGTVARIYPAGFTKVSSLGVEQQRVLVIVRFDEGELRRLLTERRLGVGYHVRVRIVTAAKDGALVVPRAALFRSNQSGWQLYVVRGGRAVLQPVEVGLMNDEQAEILSGLEADEPVVIAPESTLADGVRVETSDGTPK